MSRYYKLDYLIVEVVKDGNNSFNRIALSRIVFDEVIRIASETGRDADRIVDARLQALRKRGLIVHVKGLGWRIKEMI